MPRKRIMMVGPFPPTIGGITTFMTEVLTSELRNEYCFMPFRTERPTGNIARSSDTYDEILHVGLPCLIKCIVHTLAHVLMFPFSVVKRKIDVVHINTSDYWSFWENSL
jgi:hypothetical protein